MIQKEEDGSVYMKSGKASYEWLFPDDGMLPMYSNSNIQA